MRLGFLSKGLGKGEPSGPPPARPTAPTAPESQARAPAPQPQAQPVVLPPDKWKENFTHSLGLLQGPDDETRFVGLLLVTKLLPQGGDAAVLQVLDALGPTFIDRLLLPLTRQRQDVQPPATDEAYQQEVLSCSLALAILSSACRIPEMATSQPMLDRIPTFVKVVKAGGVASLVARPASGGQMAKSLPQEQIVNGESFSTAATLSDCLECLVSIAGSGSRAASAAVLGAGGLEAATKALAAAAGSTSVGSKKATDAAPPPGLATAGLEGMAGGAGSGAAAADGPLAQAEALHAAMLAVRLVALLLEYGAVSKTAVLSEYTDVLQHTVAALGMLVGHPSVLAQQQQGGGGGAAAAAAVGMAGSAAASAAGGHGAVGGAGAGVAGPSVAGAQGEDAAMLQLEALHALLLVLPLPQELELHHRLAGAVHRQEWPAAVRRGLNWLLRSRISAVQKHSALQLAAAMVELAGPAWLLARGEQRPEAFLQVLAETLHVETALLLHDALYPDQHVREEGGRSDTRQHWQPPQATEPFLQSLRDAAAAKEAAALQQASQTIAASAALAAAGAGPSEVAGATALPTTPTAAAAGAGAAGEGAHPVQMPQGHGSGLGLALLPHTAGERASRLLPCCYMLLECTIDVLASDSAMQEDDMMVIDEAGESEEEEEEREEQGMRQKSTTNRLNFWEGSRRGAPAQRQGQQLLQPGVSQKAAQQLMYNLETTVSVILQFMDELQEQGGGAGAGAALAGAAAAAGTGAGGRWAALQADLALGAVRVLGRFLAEAPEAHTEEFRKALPFMLRIGSSSRGAPAQDCGVTTAGPVQFLLPGLLQATSETSQPATQLRRAICKSPAALGALGAFLEAAADEAAQLAASLQAAMDKAAAVAAATGAASQASALTSAAATAVGTPAAAGGGPGSGTSSGAMSRSGSVGWMTATSLVPPIGRALRMAELARVERLMADVAALMLNVLDAKDLAAMATVGRSLSGSRGGRSFGNASGTNLAAIDALFASAAAAAPGAAASAGGAQGEAAAAAAAASMQHLGPVTRQLLPAVAAMGRWWRARSSWCTGDADLAQPQRTVELLAGARLMPRTALCCGTLAGAVLEAATKQLAARASATAATAAAAAATAGAGAEPPSAAALVAPLSPADLAPVSELVLQALQAGCCLSLTLMEMDEDVNDDTQREAAAAAFAATMMSMGLASSSVSSSSVSSSGSSTPKSPRSVRDPMLMAPSAGALAAGMFSPSGKVGKSGSSSGKHARTSTGGGPDTSMALDDFPGDAEHAWQRLSNSVVSLQELLPQVHSAVRSAGWVKQLVGAAAAAGGTQALVAPPKRSSSSVGATPMAVDQGDAAAAGSSSIPPAAGSSAVLRQQELLLQTGGLRTLVAAIEAQTG